MITVNRANPRNIVATWKQDVGPNSTRADLVASSLDGGRTWTRSTLPGLTACTGGTADAGSDPWVSSDRGGTVYFSGLTAVFSVEATLTAIVGSHSNDGGRSWPSAATLAQHAPGNETPAITGSPTRAGEAYVVWADFAMSNVKFSRTTDGGASWTAPVVVDHAVGAAVFDLAPRLLVLPDGTLLTVFGRAYPEIGLAEGYAARSRDGGRTWAPAVRLLSQPVETFFDPEHPEEELPQPLFPSAAVAPDGSVYVAVERPTSASSGAIGVFKSRDGGLTWSSATLPGVSAYAFEPSIAVDSRGTVGITWYDLRNDRPGDERLTADVWFAYSRNGGASWRQTHVAGPTDLRTAPLARHNRVGEYQGLAALRGRGFAAAFTLAAPFAEDGPTDIFYASIRPGRCKHHRSC
jgi:BNR repeat-like domain